VRADGRGRPWRDDRQALSGILFVLHTGLPWEWLPQELGYGSGMTCWRRLRDWQAAGVWSRLHRLALVTLWVPARVGWRSRAGAGPAGWGRRVACRTPCDHMAALACGGAVVAG
jgi:transposase